MRRLATGRILNAVCGRWDFELIFEINSDLCGNDSRRSLLKWPD